MKSRKDKIEFILEKEDQHKFHLKPVNAGEGWKPRKIKGRIQYVITTKERWDEFFLILKKLNEAQEMGVENDLEQLSVPELITLTDMVLVLRNDEKAKRIKWFYRVHGPEESRTSLEYHEKDEITLIYSPNQY